MQFNYFPTINCPSSLAAEPLQPADRGPFLRRVATLLDGRELGDGLISRTARQAQSEFWPGLDLSRAKDQNKWR